MAQGDFVDRQAVRFGTEDNGRRSDREYVEERREFLVGRAPVPFALQPADFARGAEDERAIGERLGERPDDSGRLQDVEPVRGHHGRIHALLVRRGVDEDEVAQAEVRHGAGRGAEVARVLRPHQHDPTALDRHGSPRSPDTSKLNFMESTATRETDPGSANVVHSGKIKIVPVSDLRSYP